MSRVVKPFRFLADPAPEFNVHPTGTGTRPVITGQPRKVAADRLAGT